MQIGAISIDSQWLRASAILGVFLVLAIIVGIGLKRFFGSMATKARSSLEGMVLTAVRSLAVWGLILAGGYYAARELSAAQRDTVIWPIVSQAFTIAWIVLAGITAMRILNAVSKWRISHAAEAGADSVRDVATRVNLVRKLLTAVVIFVGGLFVLSVAGVDTSPIVAGGALGGIVIGIALQDTLSNVFAGFFLNIDRPVRIGDLIRLESGEEGFVEEVAWRYTKVRLWSNNLLIIPNNKLSQSILTNFNLPAAPLSVYVACSVAYDSDLEHVEEVALRIATEVQNREDGGDSSWTPVVRFKEFEDSGIKFVTTLRSVDVRAQFRIHHEFIKALHKAFQQEKIEIPYPMRTVIVKSLPEG